MKEFTSYSGPNPTRSFSRSQLHIVNQANHIKTDRNLLFTTNLIIIQLFS